MSLQVLLIGSLIIESASSSFNFGSFLSFLRPLMLLLTSLAAIKMVQSSDFFVKRVIYIVATLSIIYVICEIFFIEYFSSIIFFLYKRDFRVELINSGVSFFGTTYYAGYSFLVMFYFSIINYELYDKTLKGKMAVFSFSVLVLFSQSKTMLFALIISLFIYFVYKQRGFIMKFLFIIFPFLVVSTFIIFLDEISSFLLSTDIISFKSLATLLTNREESGTLNTRLEQVVFAWNSSLNNFAIFGSGLGRDESLESLPAVFIYRYGILGLLIFILFVIWIILSSLIVLIKSAPYKSKVYALVVFMWSLTLPLTQLSGVMIEMSKMSFFSALMLGIFVKMNKRGLLT